MGKKQTKKKIRHDDKLCEKTEVLLSFGAYFIEEMMEKVFFCA